ncbi:MAG: hypothetical protein IPL39_03635 [Opitutaceae bacterium]|nr:hypothetical protein [Opitutaceae bacterium]
MKTAFRSLLYRLRYPQVRLDPGCFIRRDSRLAAGTEIGRHSRILGAHLLAKVRIGRNNQLHPGAYLSASILGDDCSVESNARVTHSTLEHSIGIQPGCLVDHVTLGAWSYIARDTILNDVHLGRFCSIGPRTIIGAGEHPSHLISTSPVFYSTRGQCGTSFAATTTFTERRTINIGHDVWIGAHVFIRDGVTIGNGCIVAAGAVVAGDIPAYSIVGGVPAKLIRPRFAAEIVARLEALAWWNWAPGRLTEAQPHLAQHDPERFLKWAETQSSP